MEHTKTPWLASKRCDAIIAKEPTADHGSFNAKEVEHYGGYLVAESMGADDRAFVLLACNSHHQLVEALAAVVDVLDSFGDLPDSEMNDERWHESGAWKKVQAAREALAAAGAA